LRIAQILNQTPTQIIYPYHEITLQKIGSGLVGYY